MLMKEMATRKEVMMVQLQQVIMELLDEMLVHLKEMMM
jgi:hypothetical protein